MKYAEKVKLEVVGDKTVNTVIPLQSRINVGNGAV